MKTGKRYAELVKLVDKSTLYDPSDAAKLVCETGKAKFDETVRCCSSSSRYRPYKESFGTR